MKKFRFPKKMICTQKNFHFFQEKIDFWPFLCFGQNHIFAVFCQKMPKISIFMKNLSNRNCSLSNFGQKTFWVFLKKIYIWPCKSYFPDKGTVPGGPHMGSATILFSGKWLLHGLVLNIMKSDHNNFCPKILNGKLLEKNLFQKNNFFAHFWAKNCKNQKCTKVIFLFFAPLTWPS